MNTTINQISYPYFVPDQVLTAKDLNGLVNYLEGLTQLTRTHLIGMGILYGLEVQVLEQGTKIQITPGCGITSEGSVIKVPEQTQTDTQLIFTHYYPNTAIPKNLFIPEESPKVYELTALGESNAAKVRDNITPLKPEALQDKVVVVLYDLQDVPRSDTCFLSYDDHGQDRQICLRFLLLPRSQAQEIPKNSLSAERLLRLGYPMEQLPEPWKEFLAADEFNQNTEAAIKAVFDSRIHFLQEFDSKTKKFKDFAPKVYRFGYTKDKQHIDISKIEDYTLFRKNYEEICLKAIESFEQAFSKLFWLFSPFFTTFNPASNDTFKTLIQKSNNQSLSNLKENLEELLTGNNLKSLLDNIDVKNRTQGKTQILKPEKIQSPYALQYFYDYLSQLVAAYYELAEAAFDLMDDCKPDTQRFPKFLMLGVVPSPLLEPNKLTSLTNETLQSSAATYAYRSHFTQPPIYNNNAIRIKQVYHLFERLLKLCEEDSFYLLPFYSTPIQITPSKDRSTLLSQQAIPYYLNYPKLYKYWNYDTYRKGRIREQSAYFWPRAESDRDDFLYRLDSYNFYRIEGHLGKTKSDVLKHIQDYKQQYNLPFDIITLKLGKKANFEELTFSGQIDDLNADFGRIKDRFQNLWKASEESWSHNVFLRTMKLVFFDKSSLDAINSDQLYNPILNRAWMPEAYEFERQNDTSKRFSLFLKDSQNNRIARYNFREPEKETVDFLDFSGLTDPDKVIEEQQRIKKALSTYLILGKITYAVEQLPNNENSFHLRLSVTDELDLPLDSGTGKPRGKSSIELISLIHFSVSIENNLPIIKQPEFQNYETLYGLLRDIPNNYTTELQPRFQMGDRLAADCLNYFEMKDLLEAYQQRIERLMKLHLFYKFAEEHPGMEHLGGTPKGGTFILVYVDDQEEINNLFTIDTDRDGYNEAIKRTLAIRENASWSDDKENSDRDSLVQELQQRKDVVVADFCLPYRSSSGTSAVSYVLARSRPIILLKKTAFCEEERDSHRFILEPEGGTVKGEGVIFDGHEYLFQPSSINQSSKDELAEGSEVVITLFYAVEETYNTLTVTIYPSPRPNLTIQEGQQFCQDASPVEIGLAQGTPETVELGLVTVNGTETKTLVPSQYAANGQQETVKIEAHLRDRKSSCTNTITRKVTINPLPKANLSISEGQNFCHDAAEFEITLAPDAPADVELVHVTINGTETKTLVPNQYATEGQPQTVTIAARIRHKQTHCENTITRTVTINPLPEAKLSINEGQNFCHNDDAVEIILASGTPADVELVQVTINGTETKTLVPNQYATEGKPQTVTIAARIRHKQTHCENTITRTVTINPLPEAKLSINEGQNFCHNDDAVEIILAPETSTDVELVQVTIDNVATTTLVPNQYATEGQPQTIRIAAQIRNKQTQCKNTITRTVTINPLPEANLSIQEGDNFCQDAPSVEITLAQGTPEEVELVQVTINGTEAKTLVPNQYATEGQPQTVTIAAQIRNKLTHCENTITRTVTINPLPEANLSVSEGQTFCNNADAVEITLASGTPADVELVQVTINGTETQTLVPNQYASEGQPQIVTIAARIRNKLTHCENTITRTITIYPLPIADFQAEIANISATGFSVRVFDIQPAGQPSFNYNWENTGGTRNTNNPDNSEFTIRYEYDFNNWVTGADVSIALQVSTPPALGGCSSEPITKQIPIPFGGIEALYLLTISPDGDTTNRTLLENNSSFPRSYFTDNYRFEALARGRVGSVIFTYTAPNGQAEQKPTVNAAPYMMPDRDWQPIVGRHQIQAQAFSEAEGSGLEGVPLTIALTITDNNHPPVTPNSPNTPTLVNRLTHLFRPGGLQLSAPPMVNPYLTIASQGNVRDASDRTRINLIQLLSLSAAGLLLILGLVSSSSKPSGNPANFSGMGKIQNAAE